MWKFMLGYVCGVASVAIYGKEMSTGLRQIADSINKAVER